MVRGKSSSTRGRLAAILGAAALVAAACGGSAGTAGASASAAASAAASKAATAAPDAMLAELGGQALIDAAVKEGAVTIYTAEVVDLYQAQVKAFNARFPQVKVEVVRQGSAQLDTQIKAEVQAGKFKGDVLSTTGDDYMASYRDTLKILGTYKPPTADKYSDTDTTNGAWYPISTVLNGIAYNTALVPEAKAPKSWADFLDPAYNGRRGFPLPLSSCFVSAVWFEGVVLGEQQGKPRDAYWKALAATKPALYTSSPEMVPPLAQGQNMVSYMIDSLALPAAAQGQPIKFVYPSEGAPTCWHSTQITANPPHPNAAKLLLNYLLSSESQKIGIDQFRIFSLRTDMPAPAGVPAGFKIWHYSIDFGKSHPTWQKEWLDIFGVKQ